MALGPLNLPTSFTVKLSVRMSESPSANTATKSQNPSTRRMRNMNNCFTCAMRHIKCKLVSPVLCENCQKAGLDQCIGHVPWRSIRAGFNPSFPVGQPAWRMYDAQANNFQIRSNHIDSSSQQVHSYYNANSVPLIPHSTSGIPHHYTYPFIGEITPQASYNPMVSPHNRSIDQIEHNVGQNAPQQIIPQPLQYVHTTNPSSQSIPADPVHQLQFYQTSFLENAPVEAFDNNYSGCIGGQEFPIAGPELSPNSSIPRST